MANHTWISLTNAVLRGSGLVEIPDDSVTFNSPNAGLMTRYQLAARECVRLVHEQVCVDLPVGFARRRFTLNIDDTQGAIYPLDTGISVESQTFDSFRNLSASPAGPGVLRNWTYEYFTKRYPDITQIYTGAPTHYINLPPLSTDESPVYRIRVFPTPDQAYTLEYVAQLNRYELLLDTTAVLWPPEYEHVIIKMARFDLEDLLGEGKAGSLGLQAYKLYEKARQKATQPRSERKGVRMKKLFNRRGARGYYNSPPDDDAPYSTPDSIR